MSSFWQDFYKILIRNRIFGQMFDRHFKNFSFKINVNKNVYSLTTLLQLTFMAVSSGPRKQFQTMGKPKQKKDVDSKAQHYLNSLKVRWMQLHEIPGVFAYQLADKRPHRIIPGDHGFYTELNMDRSLKRRAPQTIENMRTAFKPKLFNFNKVDDLEVMLTIDDERTGSEIRMIINKSPITHFHTLIVPDIKDNLIQRVTPPVLSFCINFMRNIDDPNIRIGYNSPGALASVNHLHFHLLTMPIGMYIDKVKLEELAGGFAFRLAKESPTEAICFVFSPQDDEEMISERINNIHRLTEWLCNNNLPHNIFITQQQKSENVRLFVFVREKYCVNKNVNAFNVGFCEIVGFIPLGDEERMRTLSEQAVLNRIKEVTGDNVYGKVYDEVKNIINGRNDVVWVEPPEM